MRSAVSYPLLALLSVSLLAGCVGGDDPATQEEEDTPAVATTTAPVLDGAAIVSEVQSFCEAYPKRNANGANHNAARDHLAAEFESLGYEVLRQTFDAPVSATSTPSNVVTDDGTLQNVIGVKWGADNASWVVIGGHYDVTDGAVYGCYDDGSGTILTLAMARAFRDIPTDKTIAFTMFDGEEQGLLGSQYLMGSILASDPEATPQENWAGTPFVDEFAYAPKVFAMIDLDMFGINYPAMPPIYFDQNSNATRAFVDESRKAIGIPDKQFKFTGISAGRSDYHWFMQAGIPTAFFISAFEEIYVGPVAMPECQHVADRTRCVTYPFWHQADTMQGMELMAGNRADLEAGFGVAARITSELLHWYAATPGLELDVVGG